MSTKNLIIGIILVFTLSFTYRIGNRIGFEKGFEKGFSVTIDTVQSIMQKQIKSDTTVTKLTIINNDTNVYILKQKSLKIK